MKSSFNGEWWFYYLYVELLILFLPISKLNVKRNTFIIIMLFILLISRALNTILPLDEKILISRHIKMILININIFMLGCFFAKYDIFKWIANNFNGILKKNYIQPILLILPILVRAYIPMIGITELITVPLLVFGIVNICHISKGEKILSFLGKHSMNLWLIHSFFIYYYLKNITFITNNPIIMFITVIGCSLFSSCVIEKIKYYFITNK